MFLILNYALCQRNVYSIGWGSSSLTHSLTAHNCSLITIFHYLDFHSFHFILISSIYFQHYLIFTLCASVGQHRSTYDVISRAMQSNGFFPNHCYNSIIQLCLLWDAVNGCWLNRSAGHNEHRQPWKIVQSVIEMIENSLVSSHIGHREHHKSTTDLYESKRKSWINGQFYISPSDIQSKPTAITLCPLSLWLNKKLKCVYEENEGENNRLHLLLYLWTYIPQQPFFCIIIFNQLSFKVS